MNRQEEFIAFYERKLKKRVEFLEEYRQKNIRKVKQYFILFLLCVVSFIISVWIGNEILIAVLSFPFLIFLGLSLQKLMDTSRYLRFNYKKYVLQKAIDFYFQDFEYIEEQKISASVLITSQLFPKYIDDVYGEDFMRFKIGNCSVMFCETSVEKGRKKVFKGVFIASTFNKYFKSKTFVFPRISKNFIQRIKKQLSSQLEEVRLENVHFNDRYQTISSDQQDARYILTPVMMQHLINYSEKLSMDVSFAFVENRLYCSIPMKKDLFEHSLFEPMDRDFILESLQPVLLFTDIVEDLELNHRIWSKK